MSHGPWLVVGDFHDIISSADKIGGAALNPSQLVSFNKCIKDY
jgi:hypothetical protein